MEWSEAEKLIQTVCQRLTGGGLGIIPDALYLLRLPSDQTKQLPMLLLYHEAALSDDECERLYRRVAYFGAAEMPLVRSIVYLTYGLKVSLETVEATSATRPAVAAPAGAQLLWKPGLDWSAVLSGLTDKFQSPCSLPGHGESGAHLIFGEV